MHTAVPTDMLVSTCSDDNNNNDDNTYGSNRDALSLYNVCEMQVIVD